MPDYRRLHNEPLLGRLRMIRENVTPILASNLLRSFTDHSVSHSDQVCELIDELTAPMERHPLTDTEAFILYGAAYLHDVGMQHEKCDETQTMARALAASPYLGRRWVDLEERTRWDLLRRHHHEISAEMVRSCIDAPQPTVLGIQLTHQDHPAVIAALCEAHCVIFDTDRYHDLTAEGPNIRTSLMAALLRLADILDESQHRTHRYRELTVQLDVESQMHWWRHWYVAEVTFHPEEKYITMWFEFPPDQKEEYRAVVPELQRPWIEAEFLDHRDVLLANDAVWHLKTAEVNSLHSTAVPMPEPVFLRMLQEVQRHRQKRATADRLAALRQLEEAQELVARQLQEIRQSEAGAAEKLREAEALAEQLRQMGAQHDASMIFYEAYNATRQGLGEDEAIDFARRLGEMLLADRKERLAGQVLAQVKPAVNRLPAGDPRQILFLMVWCRALIANADVPNAEQVLARLRDTALPPNTLEDLEAELAEAALLSGHYIDAPPTEAGSVSIGSTS